jgi:hypothetical protein
MVSRRVWSLSVGVLVAVVLGVFLVVGQGVALGFTPAGEWVVGSVAVPSSFSAEHTGLCLGRTGACDVYVVSATNIGTRPSSGPVVLRDRLPQGTEFHNYGEAYETEPGTGGFTPFTCEDQANVVTCEYTGVVPPEGIVSVRLEVVTLPEVSGFVTNQVEAEGGGFPRAVSSYPGTVANTVNAPPAVFGIQDFSSEIVGADGASDVQAGDHPATATTKLDWSTTLNTVDPGPGDAYFQAQEAKSEIVDLPPGFEGDAQALERCPVAAINGTELHPEKCPAGSRIGFVVVEGNGGRLLTPTLYNVPAEAGYPAEFAFEYVGAVVTLVPRVLDAGDEYVVSVSVGAIPRVQALTVTGAAATFFGDPTERDGSGGGEAALRNPTQCSSGPLRARLEADSWVDPGVWQGRETTMFEASATQGLTGCGALQFDPSLAVAPETSTRDTPSGYEVLAKVPQAPNVPGVLATPDLKDALVALPEGLSVSPAAAYGLQACPESGPEGIDIGAADKLSDDNQPQEGQELGSDGLVHPAAGHCPAASEIGEVEAVTPLLSEPLKGHVFVAAPGCGNGNPGERECTPASAEDGELFGLFLEVAGSGVIIKLRGEVSVNPLTGQVTTTFAKDPQQPVSEIRFRLNGGPRAPLANPQSCATFTAAADFTPWSTPYTPDAKPLSAFPITGCNPGFNPSFTASSLNGQAGVFTPFTVTFSRADGEGDLSGVSVGMPRGLLGKVAGVALCPEAAANAGTCGVVAPGSRVGSATAAAGAGPDPFWQSGQVYLTGAYNGGPFGLSVVVPANAGPYHLGNIVVRASIRIDPVTAAVSVVSNPLPQMVDGVPLRVKTVNVTVGQGDNFTFNPTSCVRQAVSGTLTSTQGAVADVSSPFTPTGCSGLPFKPGFAVSTAGVTSKADGASFVVKIAAKPGEANIAKTDLQLPLALPSRLTTLQKACTEAQFNANPAGCPEGAEIGVATAVTPLLNVALTGPMYLVSHGGAAFPDVEIVLQGEGVKIILDGKTDIKKGITYSNFETVPDAPLSSFEANLPEGPHSALTTEFPGVTNLCAPTKSVTVKKKVTKRVHGKSRKVTVTVKQSVPETLQVGTTLVGQNGVVVKQATKITVTGCPKASVKKAKASAEKAKAGRASADHEKKKEGA